MEGGRKGKMEGPTDKERKQRTDRWIDLWIHGWMDGLRAG